MREFEKMGKELQQVSNVLRLGFSRLRRRVRSGIPAGWQLLKQNWDIAVLAGMVLAIAGLASWIILPHPEVDLVVLPPRMETVPTVAMDDYQLMATDEGHDGVSSEAPRKHSAHKRKAKKAKAKPQVINLNSASLAQFDLLPGIGPALAGRIVAYRKSVGKFASVEQLNEVSGIGDKKLEKMRPYLRL